MVTAYNEEVPYALKAQGTLVTLGRPLSGDEHRRDPLSKIFIKLPELLEGL